MVFLSPYRLRALVAAVAVLSTGSPACQPIASAQTAPTKATMNIEKSSFGRTSDGQEVWLYTLDSGKGLTAKVMTYGATVTSVETPDREGKRTNITLGFPTLGGYLQRHPYFGSTVGRYANRIAKGKFSLDAQEYTLAVNNGPNHLHGGLKGFDAVVWAAEEQRQAGEVGVTFTYRSPDGEEGYPGNLDVAVTYSVTADNELKMQYVATTDKPTVVNLTNHCYWNLGGAASGDILATELLLSADKYLPIDAGSIPTGEAAAVKGTAFDFTAPHAIGERIDTLKKPPHQTQGYDHCFVLRGQQGKLELAARAKDPRSGRVMEVHTTEPGIQLYCGNFLGGGAGEAGYRQHAAFCLETQHYPDSPNQPQFPSTTLAPGQTFRSTTIHRFSVE